MAIMIGNERFEDAYDAAAMVIECNEGVQDVTDDAWVCPEQYIGPMFDTVHTETYRLGKHSVQVRWLFTDAETDGKDPEDYAWDNGTMAVVVDGDYVQEAE